MKIKQVTFKHPNIGEITVNSKLPKKIRNKIGTVVSKKHKKFFYAKKIKKLDNGNIVIKDLCSTIVRKFNIGIDCDSGNGTNFMKIICNHYIKETITLSPNNILILIEEESWHNIPFREWG